MRKRRGSDAKEQEEVPCRYFVRTRLPLPRRPVRVEQEIRLDKVDATALTGDRVCIATGRDFIFDTSIEIDLEIVLSIISADAGG